MKTICIIPARGGSKRLPRKNIYPLLGKPLIQWSIEACLKSKYLEPENIYVSSEDDEILNIAKNLNIQTIKRPKSLAKDNIWTQDVLKHAKTFTKQEKDDIIVRIQANSPQIEAEKIDECIEKLIKNDLWEVFTVDQNGIEDAAIHVLRGHCVFQKALSVYKGVVLTSYIDIHTLEDLEKVKGVMKNDSFSRSAGSISSTRERDE